MRSDSSFPLDAEQIVRLTGTVLTRVLNAIRHPDAKPVNEGSLILALGAATGVPVTTRQVGSRDIAGSRIAETVLAPYAAKTVADEVDRSTADAALRRVEGA